MLRNWSFFDAPHAAFFTMPKYLGVPGAVDVGIYAATLALALEERGVGSCMQGALGMFPTPARQALGLKDECGILFGMSFGYKVSFVLRVDWLQGLNLGRFSSSMSLRPRTSLLSLTLLLPPLSLPIRTRRRPPTRPTQKGRQSKNTCDF